MVNPCQKLAKYFVLLLTSLRIGAWAGIDNSHYFHHYIPTQYEDVQYVEEIIYRVIPPPPPIIVHHIVERPRGQSAKDLLDLTCRTLTDMGGIAQEDNPIIGARIIAKLAAEKDRATIIYAEWKEGRSYGKFRPQIYNRIKRQAGGSGGEEGVKNQLGNVLDNSMDAIAPEVEQLSPVAQAKIAERHDRAINGCQAEVCKSHAAKRNRIKESKAARKMG